MHHPLALIISFCAVLLLLPRHAGAEEGNPPSFDIARGKAAIATGDYREAADILARAAERDPGGSIARYYLGAVLNRAGRYREAREAFAAIPPDAPRPEGLHREQAIACLGAGDPAEARRLLAVAIEREPNDPLLLIYAGIAAGRCGDPAGMERHLAEARRLSPGLAPETHCIAAATLAAAGRPGLSAEEWRRAVALDARPALLAPYRPLLRGTAGEGPRRNRFSLDAYTGYEYDTNVSLMPNDADLVEPTGRKDWRYYVDARAAYDCVDNDRFRLNSEYDIYCGVNSHVSAYNLLTQAFQQALTYKTRLVEPTLLYRYEYSFLGAHQESFLRSQIFETPVDILQGRHTLTRLRYRYALDRYFLTVTEPEDNRSGHDNLVGFDEYAFFSAGSRHVRFGFYYDRYDATGNDWTHNGYLFTWGLFSPLPAGFSLDLGSELYLRRFPEHAEGRRDHQQAYTARVSKRLGEHLEAGFGYLTMLNSSTVPLYQFDRSIFTLFMGAHF